MKKIINGICLVFAFVFLGLGAAGAVMPVLPTTPFLLLAAFLFGKSSKKFHKWFVGTNLYQKYIDQAIRKKAMTKESKRNVLITLGLLFTIAYIVSPIWHAKALILVVAAFHAYCFLFRIRTVTKEEAEGEDPVSAAKAASADIKAGAVKLKESGKINKKVPGCRPLAED